MANKQQQRSNLTLWVAIILGLVLGFFFKKVRFGFIFGMVLAVAVVYFYRKKK
jgi:uncharacterized protein YqgC (DUF456 family)